MLFKSFAPKASLVRMGLRGAPKLASLAISACAIGCGAPQASVPPATATPAPPTAPEPAPAAARNSCGGFEALQLDANKVSLLGDRLSMHVLEGSTADAAPAGVMEPDASAQLETRVFLSNGDKKLVILSEELGALAGDSYLETVKANSPRLATATFREETLPSGLPVVLALHDDLSTDHQAIPLAHAFSKLEDGTAQATHVFVNSAVVEAGAGGCVDLAVRLLSTLAPGQRKLDLAGGERSLSNDLTLTLPAGQLLVKQRGPDFELYRILMVRDLGTAAPHLGIYLGHHPSFEVDDKAKRVAGNVLGQAVEWQETVSQGIIERETLVKRGDLAIHLFLAAASPEDADTMTQVASTLKAVSVAGKQEGSK